MDFLSHPSDNEAPNEEEKEEDDESALGESFYSDNANQLF